MLSRQKDEGLIVLVTFVDGNPQCTAPVFPSLTALSLSLSLSVCPLSSPLLGSRRLRLT